MLATYQISMVKEAQRLKVSQAQLNVLVALAQKGDARAKDLVALTHAPLCAKRALAWGADAEEAFSIASMGVALAINTYKVGSDASFTTWASLKVDGEMSIWIRSKNMLQVPNNRRLAIHKEERHCNKNGLDIRDMLDHDAQYDYACIKGSVTSISTPIGDGTETIESMLPAREDGRCEDDIKALDSLLDALPSADSKLLKSVAEQGIGNTASDLGMSRNAVGKRYKSAIGTARAKAREWAL